MPRPKRNQAPRVGESLETAIDVIIKKFLNSEDLKEWEFPSSFTAAERAYVHQLSNKFGLKSKSRGKGFSRYLTIFKRDGSAIIQKDATMNLTPASRTLLSTLLSRYPVTAKERQDCLPPIERCKDAYYQDGTDTIRALGRISVTNPQVPSSSNKQISPFRASLPVYSSMDSIVQTINDNSVTIITGHTGSGKTTQIPQYLLEWHEKTQKPCMILCSQPRRIAAVSVSERVATERGEKQGHSVGYQIRLEGKSSSNTVLMYCTNGVLLRTLMAGEGMLSSVTHIIIDEVHEREKLADFILIVLREAIEKFRSLKLILMSATFDAKQFSGYFNNCPVISIPGKSFEVKEYYLEDILKQTGYMSSEMERLRKELEKRNNQKIALDKWTSAMTQGAVDLPNYGKSNNTGSNEKMDRALLDAWLGKDNAFPQLLYYIQSEQINIDYQHSETGITTLMVAAAKGMTDIVEQLLNLGANILIKSSNEYTAFDWAKHFSRQEISDILEAFALNFEQNTTASFESNHIGQKKLSEADIELLDLYNTSFSSTLIDNKLILALIAQIHMENNKGGILIFLPGYAEITALRELILSEMNRLCQKTKILLLMLHSNMQTSDQKLVFRPTPPNTRKIILSTNIAETSLTIEDIYYVIDSGKIKEKSYNVVTGASQLTTVWISRSSALQRMGRAGRTQPGVCYRMYSSIRYERMENNSTPELLRTPLTELCLYSKQLAPPNTSIVDFLSRAVDPPSSAASRTAVSLLKTIDALDTWEDLTDLGHHLLDLPVDPRYGKMLLYSVVLKCLDPVLTIVSCLSYRELFTLPDSNTDKKRTAVDRSKFSHGSLSDHMVLLKTFQAWQDAKKQGKDKQFCFQNCVSGSNMEMVMGTRAQILAQLRASGFVKSKAPLDIKYVNTNSENWAVVKAALIGGLYPNIARVDKEHNVLRSLKEHRVKLHTTSALNDGGKKGTVEKLPSDWIMYEEMTKVGCQSQIRVATVVSPITVAIFAGPAKIPLDALTDFHIEGSAGSDSEEDEVGPNQTATLKVDEWATFRLDSEAAQLALQLRVKWHSLLAKKLRFNKVLNYMEEMVINSLVKVLSAEEQFLGLIQPPDVGKRPHLMMSDTSKRFNGQKFDDNSSPVPNLDASVEAYRSSRSAPCRYFIIKNGQLKNIEPSIIHKMWLFSPVTHQKIGGKTVILIFNIQGTNQFQGYARLTSDNPVNAEMTPPELSGHPFSRPLPVEWIKRANVPFHASKHLVNPYNEYAKVQASREGQEIEPSVGEVLCKLWEGVQFPINTNYFNRGSRVRHPPMYFGNHNFKM